MKAKITIGALGVVGGMTYYLQKEAKVKQRHRLPSLDDLRRAGVKPLQQQQQQQQQQQETETAAAFQHDFTANLTTVFGLRGYFVSTLRATRSRHLRRMILCSIALTVATRRYFRSTSIRTLLLRCFCVFWGLFYHFKVVEHPTISFLHTHWNSAVSNRMRLSPFRPTLWAFNCHAQTVICNGLNGLMAHFGRDVPVTRETIKAYDGNDIHLDWTVKENEESAVAPDGGSSGGGGGGSSSSGSSSPSSQLPEASPIVLVCHGIFGDADESYVRNIGALCRSRGWRAVVNWRWRLDFGESRDINAAIEHIQRRFPAAPIVAVGYSAGGHLLASYLQDVGADTPLVAAVIASASFDLVDTMDGVSARGSECSYLRAALNVATRNCVHRHIAHDRFFDFEALDAEAQAAEATAASVVRTPQGAGGSTSMPSPSRAAVAERKRATEELLRAMATMDGPTMYDAFLVLQNEYSGQHTPSPVRFPQHARYGRKTDGHYNRTAGYNMHKIGITTMVVHADDDPVTADTMRRRVYGACARNKHIIRVSTRRGGHVGWHEDTLCTGPSWADMAVVEFFSGVFALHSQTSFMLDVTQEAARSAAASRLAAAKQHQKAPSPRALRPCSGSEDNGGDGDHSDTEDGAAAGDGDVAPPDGAAVPAVGFVMHPSRIARICSKSDLVR